MSLIAATTGFGVDIFDFGNCDNKATAITRYGGSNLDAPVPARASKSCEFAVESVG